MDLAADQCTFFLIQRPGTIRRFNVTGAFLPDFAMTQLLVGVGLRVLPDGGLLVSTTTLNDDSSQLERCAPNGEFLQSFPTGLALAMMLTEGGTRMRHGEEGCSESTLVTRDVATGEIRWSYPTDGPRPSARRTRLPFPPPI